jgi:hypothetical protein
MSDTTQTQANAQVAPTTPEKLTVWELLKILTVGQAWALIACLVAIVVGSAALGGWAQSAHDDDKLAEKNATIQDLKTHQSQDTANVDAARNTLKAMEASDRALRGKAEFLERFLAYKLNGADTTKNLFINHVCALWKQSQELSIHLDKAPLNLSDFDLRRGLAPEVRKLLIDNGVPNSFLDQASGPEPARVQPIGAPPDVTRTPASAIANVQKVVHGNDMRLLKIVHFFDGTSYEVPNEVAAAVHANKDCAPK